MSNYKINHNSKIILLMILVLIQPIFTSSRSDQIPNYFSYRLSTYNNEIAFLAENISIFQGYIPNDGSIISFSNLVSNVSGVFGSMVFASATSKNTTNEIKLSNLFLWNMKNQGEWDNFVLNYDINHQNNSYRMIRYDKIDGEILIASQSNNITQIIDVNTTSDVTQSIIWLNNSFIPNNYLLGQFIFPPGTIKISLIINKTIPSQTYLNSPSYFPLFIFSSIIFVFPILYFSKDILVYIKQIWRFIFD